MKASSLFLLILFPLNLLGQQRRLISIDFASKKADTLSLPNFNDLQTSENTPYNLGRYNDLYENLEMQPPIENINEGTKFTLKEQASKFYNINNFPIRTSVKIFAMENGKLKGLCSGSMISRKHVLTAAHCVVNFTNETLSNDSVLVCPIVDDGTESSNFSCSWVKKAYFFEKWRIYETDVSVLELQKPIGEHTGWISIGYDADDSSILDGIYYKFSYPAVTFPEVDPREYNGDTLYFTYGNVNLALPYSIGVRGAEGIPGESGSSLIKVLNGKIYTSYGVLSTSNDYIHDRLINWKYYGIKAILKNDLQLKSPLIDEAFDIAVYPNPATNHIKINCPETYIIEQVVIMDAVGRKIIERNNLIGETEIDISSFPAGAYIVIGNSGSNWAVKRIIKKNK